VLEAERRRIHKVRIRKPAAASAGDGAVIGLRRSS